MIIAGFCSCDKEEELTKTKQAKIELETRPNNDRGGDDDEDPIIQGLVIRQGIAISNPDEISIISDSSNLVVETTQNNGFTFKVPSGSYKIKVKPENEPAQYTAPFVLNENSSATITLE